MDHDGADIFALRSLEQRAKIIKEQAGILLTGLVREGEAPEERAPVANIYALSDALFVAIQGEIAGRLAARHDKQKRSRTR